MEVININEEQKSKLCEELAKLVFEFKKDSQVKCIYFAPYKYLGNVGDNIIEVTLVRDPDESDNLDKKVQSHNSFYQQEKAVDEFGLRIFVDTENAKRYSIAVLNPFKRNNDLFNSVILFDQTGEFTRIKEQTSAEKAFEDTERNFSRPYYYYEDRAEIVPPITDEVYKAMEVMQMKRDTEAVKQFTKSKLFEQFKNVE